MYILMLRACMFNLEISLHVNIHQKIFLISPLVGISFSVIQNIKSIKVCDALFYDRMTL